MLLEFSVGNYRSFNEVVTFSMAAAKLKAKDRKLDLENVFNVGDTTGLLKSAAIYGANSSGKSNFIKALAFMKEFVINSSKESQSKDLISIERFRLSTETATIPTFFEGIFLLEGKKYRYGFEVTPHRVVSEWLFYTPVKREVKLFTRDLDEISYSNVFREGKGIVEKTRENALFLSVVAQFNGEIAQKTLHWFRTLNVLSRLTDLETPTITLFRLQDQKTRAEVVRFIKNMDLGISDIQLARSEIIRSFATAPIETVSPVVGDEEIFITNIIDNRARSYFKVQTSHQVYDGEGKQVFTEKFDLDKNESEGTKKLFALAGVLLIYLKLGGVLIVDELDARLHPLLTCAIIRLFNSRESNPNNAQLIFTTHDTNLLSNSMFRRDQIWFTEKNKQGATSLYSLAEFKLKDGDSKVRNDASFEKDYIQGKYGAIPFIGDFSKLMGKSNG